MFPTKAQFCMLTPMKFSDPETFTLHNFEGPINFLLHLIQKNEIDIYDVDLQEIMGQFLSKLTESDHPDVESGAEFIGTASLLIWLKSRMLLPRHEQPLNLEEENDPRFEIIHQLMEYCRFKDAAKDLSEREQKQNAYFGRGLDDGYQAKRHLGIEHLTLEDLAGLFQQILAKSQSHTGLIHEEEWLVSDKIRHIRQLLKQSQQIGFEELFSFERSREELIVTFLAVLELMKLGELRIIKESNKVMIIGYDRT